METDARIQDLPEAYGIYGNDRFVLEQRGQAFQIPARIIKSQLKGDKGDPGTQGPQGKPGTSSVITDVPDGAFAMNINEKGELILTTNKNTPLPGLSIDPKTGNLIYEVTGNA